MTRLRTHIGREIDPKYPSNRLALNVAALAGFAGAAFGWWGERHWQVAGVTALAWAGTSFLAWATTRELLHDNPRPAVFAAVLAPAGAALFGPPAFLIGVTLLFVGRLSLGSTGRNPLTSDLAVVTVLGLWIARTPAGWAVAIVLAVALARIGAEGPNRGRWWAFGLAAGATAVMVASGGFVLSEGNLAVSVALVAGALMGAGIAARTPPRVPVDTGGPPPSASDQSVARILVLSGTAAATLISADPAIAVPAVAGLVALALRTE